MRIVIDMQGVQSESRFRGIGRYSLSLALAIARNAEEHEVWLALNAAFPESVLDIRDAFRNLIPQEHICVFEVPSNVTESKASNEGMVKAAELLREYFLAQLNPDVVLITSLFEGYIDDAVTSIGALSSNVFTAAVIYDLIPYLYQDKYLLDSKQYSYYMNKINALKKANLLFAISESSRNEASDILGIDQSKVVNISAAVGYGFRQIHPSLEEKNVLYQKYNITRNMIMYAPGGFDERKNCEGLIHAYALLPQGIRKKHQLIVVSRISDRQKHDLKSLASAAGLGDDELVITGYVPDEDLIALYNSATLFVFPSKHEGFGFPALEAMSCGAPVIASNTTSLPEVVGCEDALFDPDSAESIAGKIEEVLTDEVFRNKLIGLQQKHRDKFSWDISAKKVLKVLTQQVQKKKSTTGYRNFINSLVSLLIHQNTYDDQALLSLSNCISKNNLTHKKRTLYIDITRLYLQDLGTGIQRVVRSTVSETMKNNYTDFDIELVYLEYSGSMWNYKKASQYKNKLVKTSLDSNGDIVEPNNGDIFLGLDLVYLVADAEEQKLFSRWKCKGVKISFVVYDILPILRPEWWPEQGSKVHARWLETILNVADNIISISNSVSQEVQQFAINNHVKNPTIKYSYFHLGADISSSQPTKGMPVNGHEVLSVIKENISFIIVGTLEPRKGHMQTLRAFELLWAEGVDIVLVMVGKEGWLVDELSDKIRNHPELDKRLFWLEGISDEYLGEVYDASTCLMSASEGEGFGLPLIEAAQKKKPIICRDIPVFREVAGEYSYYFKNDTNPATMAKAIEEWLLLYKEGKHPKSDNMPWLTWEESTKQLLKCLNINLWKVTQPLRLAATVGKRIFKHIDHQIVNTMKYFISKKLTVPNERPLNKKQKLMVDCSHVYNSNLNTGIQRVVKNLVKNLEKRAAKNNLEVITVALVEDLIIKVDIIEGSPFQDNSLEILDRIKRKLYFYVSSYKAVQTVYKGDILLMADASWGLDIWESISYAKRREAEVIGITYDLIPISHPQFCDAKFSKVFEAWYKKSLLYFSGYVAISKTVMDDTQSYLKSIGVDVGDYSFDYFHLGSDFTKIENENIHVRKELKDIYENTDSVYIIVSTIEPRKNHQYLFDSFKKLWLQGIDVTLVIIGKVGWKIEGLINEMENHVEYKKRLRVFNDLSDNELSYCYKSSKALLFPSFIEGYGLPIVESLQSNLPVLASDIPIHHEVGGDMIDYFDVKDKKALVKRIERIESGEEPLKPVNRESLEVLTWEESAGQLLECLNINSTTKEREE